MLPIEPEEEVPAYNSPKGVVQEGLRYFAYKDFLTWYEEWKKLDNIPEQPAKEYWNQGAYLYELMRKAEEGYHTLYDMMEGNNNPIYDLLTEHFYGDNAKSEEEQAQDYLAKRCFWEKKAQELQKAYAKDKSTKSLEVLYPTDESG